MVGSTLNHYRVVRLLGRGGMGEVYAAEDTRLGRLVALKVLPGGTLTTPADEDRLVREARAVAALNHPNIVTVYSIEHAAGTPFLTMELVEGKPLTDLIPRHGLPFARCLDIGIQIAEAVSAAHQKGVIHRDLKPANILMTGDGTVKVLDFGLAKLKEAELAAIGEMPTTEMSGAGRIVGTVAYMSPEQAEGLSIDHRSDIFSLGIVLYELATGERPFKGDTGVAVISSLMKDAPRSVSEINPSVPSAMARVIRTCLNKDPERRYQSAKDVRNELRTIKEELASGAIDAPTVVRAEARQRKRLVAAALAIGGLTVAALAIWMLRSPNSVAPAASLSLKHTKLTATPGHEDHPSISPDGEWIVYAGRIEGNSEIYLQSIGGSTPINLTKDSGDDTQPVYSPDGHQIAFRSSRDGGGLWVMGQTGDRPRRVTTMGFDPSWSPDGTQLVFATATARVPSERNAVISELWIADIAAGKTTRLRQQESLDPTWSPNGRYIAFWSLGTIADSTLPVRDLWIMPAAGGTASKLTDDPAVDWSPVWSADGKFLYFSSDRSGSYNLWRLPMDPESGKPIGPAESVPTPSAFLSTPRIANDGRRIVYSSWSADGQIFRVPFDDVRNAAVGDPVPITKGTDTWRWVDPSPDGKHVVLGTGYLTREDLFIAAADGSGLHQLTSDAFYERNPRWSPAGDLIAFFSNRSGSYQIWTVAPDGILHQITFSPEALVTPIWSPDGQRMMASNNRTLTTVLFDPKRPWTDQQGESLPPPPGEPPPPFYSNAWTAGPDGGILGQLGGVLTLYDLSTHSYHRLGTTSGSAPVPLSRGRVLFVQSSQVIRVLDRMTGREFDILRANSGQTFGPPRMSADNRWLYFPRLSTESDVWMTEIDRRN